MAFFFQSEDLCWKLSISSFFLLLLSPPLHLYTFNKYIIYVCIDVFPFCLIRLHRYSFSFISFFSYYWWKHCCRVRSGHKTWQPFFIFLHVFIIRIIVSLLPVYFSHQRRLSSYISHSTLPIQRLFNRIAIPCHAGSILPYAHTNP